MVKDLSPAQLSTLWLLHDRHTNRHAVSGVQWTIFDSTFFYISNKNALLHISIQVEKAIELGLPLWKEAVHLARACHRSNMDLAGGACELF